MYDTAVFVYCSCEVPYLTILVASITMKAAMRHITNKTVKHSSLLSKTIEVIFSTFLKKRNLKNWLRGHIHFSKLSPIFSIIYLIIFISWPKWKYISFIQHSSLLSVLLCFVHIVMDLFLKQEKWLQWKIVITEQVALVMYFGSSRLTYSL